MKTELERLKEIIEDSIGHPIDTKQRSNNLAFARSVFCKIAREELSESYSFERIGRAINRDHSTVIHNINKVFDYAVQDKRYDALYKDAVATLIEERPSVHSESAKSIRETLNSFLNAIEDENNMLRDKLSFVTKQNERITSMFEGLSIEDTDEVMAKLDLFVKAMRQRTYR